MPHFNISYSINGGPRYFIDINNPMIRFYEPKNTFPGIYEFWNSVSNFWYILIGLQLLRRRSPIAIPLIMVGIFSFMFHATGHFIWEMMDELSILVLIHSIFCQFGFRVDLWITVPFILYFIGIYIFNSFLIFYTMLTFLSFLAVCVLHHKAKTFYKIHLFNDMITCFVIGKFFWSLEHMGYCWWGHSFWHLFSALSLGYAGLIIDL